MSKPQKRSHLPFLVTLAGCVLMLAWVDPAKANELSKQLGSRGIVISQISKSEAKQVKASRQNIKLILNGSLHDANRANETYSYDFSLHLANYSCYTGDVKRSKYSEILIRRLRV